MSTDMVAHRPGDWRLKRLQGVRLGPKCPFMLSTHDLLDKRAASKLLQKHTGIFLG